MGKLVVKVKKKRKLLSVAQKQDTGNILIKDVPRAYMQALKRQAKKQKMYTKDYLMDLLKKIYEEEGK